jgi:general secretion pathway protein G
MELKISQKRVSRRIKWPQDGFSLIELLVVVAIIAILAGLILQTAGYVQNRAARSRAQTEIAAISAALESYRADYGDYPRWTNNAPGSANMLFRALVLSNASLNPLGKVYLDAPASILKTPNQPNSTTNELFDPFGQPYEYRYPGDSNRNGSNFFDLWSHAGVNTNATNAPRWEKNW